MILGRLKSFRLLCFQKVNELCRILRNCMDGKYFFNEYNSKNK